MKKRARRKLRPRRITPFLWFDGQAEEAARFYVSLFRGSKILEILRCGAAGPGPKGSVMTVAFQLEGQRFIALNGGPHFKFNEAVSFVVECDTQKEIDVFWRKLGAGGVPQQCGWLKDRYGLSWQIVPSALPEMITDPDPGKARRTMEAMLGMVKLDLAELERAWRGEGRSKLAKTAKRGR